MRFLTIWILAITLMHQQVSGQSKSPAPSAPDASFWRTTQNCGANCLFLMLRARGHEISYQELLDATPIGPSGSTLPDLVKTAGTFGVEARVGKGSPTDIEQATLPIMIHLDPSTGEVRRSGHYVLVTDIDHRNGIVHLFDGLSALKSSMSWNELRRTWSGYALEIIDRRSGVWKVVVSLGSVLCGIWILRRRWAQLRGVQGKR